jgi:hypothetical protein
LPKKPQRTVRDRRKLGKKSVASPVKKKPTRGPALKPSVAEPRSHLKEMVRKLPAFQQATRYRYSTLAEIRDAARRSKPVAQTLQRTTGLSYQRLDDLMDREFLEIHPVNRRLKEINETRGA